jgi:hypothetical protein
MENRRIFLKKAASLGITVATAKELVLSPPDLTDAKLDGTILKILSPSANGTYYCPLEEIQVKAMEGGTVLIYDGQGRNYLHLEGKPDLIFQAGGALGNQVILYLDKKQRVVDFAVFRLDTRTKIEDETGEFGELLDILYWTMVKYGVSEIYPYQGKFYHVFVCWLRDHVHTMKGMKYFYPELKSGIDLYADSQRKDGMIWDNIYPRTKEKNWWDRRFSYDGFIRQIEDGQYEFKRIPVENDVEYLFIEGLYYTWKATGDDRWMESHLDKAIKAVKYSTTDPYRWSEKFKLLKRGFTIDTWDFQSNEDTAMNEGHDIMVVELGKTRFGIMFGDNTGMAVCCRYLAEMLEHANQKPEAEKYRQLGKDLMTRLNVISWNGEFYTHHIPEDPNVIRDFGVDQSRQVSLSNAYSINRDINHDQCVSIIKTYQRIRNEMPNTSPGEWYTIFPPFEYGFGSADSTRLWEYMNGGVTSIVAGELAHGAFEHGYEEYGVDILRRIRELARKTNNYLYCTYRGAMPEVPERNFTTIDFNQVANSVFPDPEAVNNDQKRVWEYPSFHEVPFNLINPESGLNNCLQFTEDFNKTGPVLLDINQKATSLYFLHTSQSFLVGMIILEYEDNSEYVDYISAEKSGSWWTEEQTNGENYPDCKKAWRSVNHPYYQALYLYGMNNPYPDKKIRIIQFERARTRELWNILGVTLCDTPVFFIPAIVSSGIPDNWGAAAVTYALIEGLAGIKDTGIAFDTVILAPRWEAAGLRKVKATAKYEASGGYLSYMYQYDTGNGELNITFTGNAGNYRIKVLLPADTQPSSVSLNGNAIHFNISRIEDSLYLSFDHQGVGVHFLKINL